MATIDEDQYYDLLSRPETVAQLLSDSTHLSRDQFIARYAKRLRPRAIPSNDLSVAMQARAAAASLLDDIESLQGWVGEQLDKRDRSSTGQDQPDSIARATPSAPHDGRLAGLATIIAVALFFAERENRARAADADGGDETGGDPDRSRAIT